MPTKKRNSINVRRKKKRGRPATGVDPLVNLRLPPATKDRIKQWAARQDDRPSLSEAIRRLIDTGLRVDGLVEEKYPSG